MQEPPRDRSPRKQKGFAVALWRAARQTGMAGLGRALAARWPFLVKTQITTGRYMYVDLRSSIGRGIFAKGSFDMAAIQPALDTLKPGATFVDVGANIGFYSLLAYDCVVPTGHIYCFEIDPRPLRALRRTVTAFALDSIRIVEAAVADVDGVVTFVPAVEHGHTAIARGNGPGRSVPSVRLDTWAEKNGLVRLDVLKIDVEGAERLVLEGARKTIRLHRPVILCEASALSEKFGYHPDDLIRLFQSLGYSADWLEGVWTPTLLARPRP